MKPTQIWKRCAEWADVAIGPAESAILERFRSWLIDEAVPAGVIGPAEIERIDRRHIGDSILFARCFSNPTAVVDFGSGAGLPGIPLAITHPGTDFTLIERSGRRVDLLRRLARILDLPNIEVIQGDVDSIAWSSQVIVSRATLIPEEAREVLAPRLAPDGVLVLGGSWVSSPSFRGWTTVPVPYSILDQEVWLLMMRAT